MKETSAFVPVEQEPLHKELFRNSKIRLYRAVLLPGVRTAVHRHDQDTVYIVCSGGKIRTTLFPGSRRCPTVLPAWITIFEKVRLIAGKLKTGALNLPAGFLFYMPSQTYPVIHAAVSDKTNTGPMDLIGIELYGDRDAGYQRNGRRTRAANVFSIHQNVLRHIVLSADQTVSVQAAGKAVCIVSCGASSVVHEQEKDTTLAAGDFLWRDTAETLTIQNRNTSMVTIILLLV